MTDKQKKEIYDAMKRNGVTKAYVTEDGIPFLKKNDAENHARSFNGKKREKALGISEVTESEVKPKEPEKNNK